MSPISRIADRFELQERVASGGMGTVYRAWDAHAGGPVAVKLLHRHGVEDAERFAREAGVLAQLSHPGIVRYVAHGTAPDGECYLVTEWLQGPTLRHRVRQGPLSVPATLALGRQVSDALTEAHQHGVVHRDIKPSNLVLVDDAVERVKVIDFGVARRLRDNRDLTLAGVMVGTPGYVSPEQARGDRRIDARSDVFSLGCVLFECLTGHAAFVGQNVTAAAVKVLLEEEPPLRQLREGVPESLETLVERMLNKDPDDRPADAAAVASALRRIEDAGMLGPTKTGRTRRRRTSSPDVRRTGLTGDEQRVLCLVMASAPMETPLPFDEAKFLHELSQSLDKFGVQLQPVADGALLATLQGRGSATDLAARAARCALAMTSIAGDRAVVVVTGRGVLSGQTPVGEVIDRAVRVLAGATAGSVRIDDATAGLLDARFDVVGLGAALVLREERDAGSAVRTFLGKPTVCVGRDRELGVLQGIFDECASEPVSRAVLLTGPAGVGKSHVRYELMRRLRERETPVEVLIGRGDPLAAGSPFAMIVPAIRKAAGITTAEPLPVRHRKLRARLGRNLTGARLDRVADFLGELVGAPADIGPALQAARSDALVMGDAMCVAWQDWLAAECEVQPVLLILEDLQWGDLPSVKFVDAALRNLNESPLMVLALARPEVHTQFPGLWAERATQEVRLFGLSRKASEKIVRNALGDGAEPEVVAHIIERADGNAFFLEELIRTAPAGRTEELPDTVLGVIQARLDALGDQAKRVLRAASVFGATFWSGGVRELLGDDPRSSDVAAWLDELVAREMIVRRPASVLPAETEYVFRSSLVRDAAYAMLTPRDRTLGHALAGAWLERAGERDAVAMAEHFHRGEEPARAVAWYMRAAEQALEGNDLAGAVERAERGVLCGAKEELRGTLRFLQAEACNWRGEFAHAEARATEAASLLPVGSQPWFLAVTELVGAAGRQGRYDVVAEWVDRARTAPAGTGALGPRIACLQVGALQLRNAGRGADADRLLGVLEEAAAAGGLEPHALARVHIARAHRQLDAGDPAAYLEGQRAALELLESAGDMRGACRARVDVGYAYLELGDFERAEATLRQVLATAERLGLQNVVGFALNNLGFALAHLGRLDEGRSVEERAIRAFEGQGNLRFQGASRAYLSMIACMSGDPVAAESEARKAAELLEAMPPDRAMALAVLVRALLEQGRAADALAPSNEALQIVTDLGGIPEGESAVRLTRAEVLHALGRLDEARATITEARARLLERASRIADRASRESLLARIPDNARTLALARAWGCVAGTES